MKIKEQTRKLAAGCSKHCFEVVDRTDEVSSKHCFEVVDRTDEVSNPTYGKVTLTRFEEIFEEYKSLILRLRRVRVKVVNDSETTHNSLLRGQVRVTNMVLLMCLAF